LAGVHLTNITEFQLVRKPCSEWCSHYKCARVLRSKHRNFINNVSTAAVFLDIEKAYDTTWHPGFLCKLSKFIFRPA